MADGERNPETGIPGNPRPSVVFKPKPSWEPSAWDGFILRIIIAICALSGIVAVLMTVLRSYGRFK